VHDRVDDLVLLGARDVLPPDGISRLLDKLEHLGSDAEVEPVDRALDGLLVDVVDPEPLAELTDGRYRLVETLLPVGHVDLVPLGSRRRTAGARRWVYGMPSARRRASPNAAGGVGPGPVVSRARPRASSTMWPIRSR